jgi:hypothetical protein
MSAFHRFIQIDDLTTGQTTVTELMAADAAAIYPAELQALLAIGHTVRIGDTLHCDLQAFLRTHRSLPAAMTRPPVVMAKPTHAASFDAGLAEAPSVASDDALIEGILSNLRPDGSITIQQMTPPKALSFHSIRGGLT